MSLFVSTSAVDYLERLVSEMTYCLLSGTLNSCLLIHSVTFMTDKIPSVSSATGLQKRRRQRTSHGEMSGVESGATGNLRKAVSVPQGTHQGGTCRYHRLPAAVWPASGQRQCIAGGRGSTTTTTTTTTTGLLR